MKAKLIASAVCVAAIIGAFLSIDQLNAECFEFMWLLPAMIVLIWM